MQVEPKIDAAEITFFEQLQSLMNLSPVRLPKKFSGICGVDAAYSRKGNRTVATAVLFLNGVQFETSTYSGRFAFPYVSGLFYLNEGPFVNAAVKKLKTRPQLVCFDAQGIAHPRFKGLATICGMVLGMPSIGISKRALTGRPLPYKPELDKLHFRRKDVGFVTKEDGQRFWSPGYSVSLRNLEEIIYREGKTILKTLETAHILSRRSVAKLDNLSG